MAARPRRLAGVGQVGGIGIAERTALVACSSAAVSAAPIASASGPTSAPKSVAPTISSVRRIMAAATSTVSPSAKPPCAASARAAITAAYSAMRLCTNAGAIMRRWRRWKPFSLVSRPLPRSGRAKKLSP